MIRCCTSVLRCPGLLCTVAVFVSTHQGGAVFRKDETESAADGHPHQLGSSGNKGNEKFSEVVLFCRGRLPVLLYESTLEYVDPLSPIIFVLYRVKGIMFQKDIRGQALRWRTSPISWRSLISLGQYWSK